MASENVERAIVNHLKEKSDPVAGTPELAKQAGLSRQDALTTLKDMDKKGIIGGEKIGQSFAWYLQKSGGNKTKEIVETLRKNKRPFMGTGELADEMGYTSNPGVAKHLERAEEKGEIKKTTISGYNVWYLPDIVQKSEEKLGADDAK